MHRNNGTQLERSVWVLVRHHGRDHLSHTRVVLPQAQFSGESQLMEELPGALVAADGQPRPALKFGDEVRDERMFKHAFAVVQYQGIVLILHQ